MSSIDFTSFLKLMAHQKASDLFITPHLASPSMKVHGKISPLTQNPLTPQPRPGAGVMNPQQREGSKRRTSAASPSARPALALPRVVLLPSGRSAWCCVASRPDQRRRAQPPAGDQDAGDDKRGIIIFVGATGTGKSASSPDDRLPQANSTGHIITIEDPIEFVHKHEGCTSSRSAKCASTPTAGTPR
jgi:twitching motility protein PilU